MVFTLILLALCVSSNANPAAPAPPSYPLPPPEGQCPNDWWSYAGDLCIQLDHEPDDFEGALWHCQHWEDHAAEIQEFLLTNEDWSLLLTVERLNYLNTLAKRPFHHKIWLNAIWFQSKWYQIVRYHHRKSYREHIEDGDAVVIPPAEINKLSLEDTHFSDGDNLVYNPENDSVFKRWKGSKSRFSYVCTHRKEHKDLINVDVQVVDENDAPLPAFLWVEDKSGTWLIGNNGEYQFPDVEIGTEFRFTAGFSPIPNELAHKDVIVEPGIGLIKVQLRSGKVKVQFCVIDDNGDPVEGAMVAINGGAPVGTDSAGLIPPTTEAFPCATILNYVVDGPVNPDTNLPIFFQVTGKYVVPKTSLVEVLETIPLTPTPLPVYKDLENCYDGTDPEPDWKIYIIEIVTPGVDEAGCKIACDANPDCDYIATSVILPPADCIPADCPPTEYFCYLASYNGPDPATPIPPTDITATQPKYSYNAGIAASVNEAFEAISKFSSIVAVHYEIFRGLARDKTDCAIRCLVSCEIPELDCDYYIYNEVNQECIMGNIVYSTATGIPPTTPDEYLHDDRPLTVINYKKAEIPRIESQLLNGFTAETCPNNLVVIEDSTNLDVNDGLTPCKYAIYNNLGGKVKITLGSTWAQSTPVTVTIGRQVTGVTICSLSSANAECVWSDAVAIVTGFGDGGVPDTDTAVISYTAPPPPPSG